MVISRGEEGEEEGTGARARAERGLLVCIISGDIRTYTLTATTTTPARPVYCSLWLVRVGSADGARSSNIFLILVLVPVPVPVLA